VRRNVELKAHARDLAELRTRLLELGAVEAGAGAQRDTYFDVRRGRLKLREEEGQPALLIPYDRPDDEGARASEYDLVEVPAPAALIDALARTVGVRGVVAKTRRLLLWEKTVRVHLDDVAGLGTFLEIEAVAAPASDLERERDQVARLSDALGIAAADIVAGGYADLLLG
jgi:predicted adenylyl cyclase CyaB